MTSAVTAEYMDKHKPGSVVLEDTVLWTTRRVMGRKLIKEQVIEFIIVGKSDDLNTGCGLLTARLGIHVCQW
jgi:hypothetical protein